MWIFIVVGFLCVVNICLVYYDKFFGVGVNVVLVFFD